MRSAVGFSVVKIENIPVFYNSVKLYTSSE
jgi:hypothetical protein